MFLGKCNTQNSDAQLHNIRVELMLRQQSGVLHVNKSLDTLGAYQEVALGHGSTVQPIQKY